MQYYMFIAFFSYLCKNNVPESDEPEEGDGMN